MIRVVYTTTDENGVAQRSDLVATANPPLEWDGDTFLDMLDWCQSLAQHIGMPMDWRFSYEGGNRDRPFHEAQRYAATLANDQGAGPGRLTDPSAANRPAAADQVERGDRGKEPPASSPAATSPAGSLAPPPWFTDPHGPIGELVRRLGDLELAIYGLAEASGPKPGPESADRPTEPRAQAQGQELRGMTAEQRSEAARKAAATRRANRARADQASQGTVDRTQTGG